MVNHPEIINTTLHSAVNHNFRGLNDPEDEIIPIRTNFSKVILKTYSKVFNLRKERKRTEEMVTLSR